MIHWGGLKCCLGAVALYLLSRRTGRTVEFLKSAIRVSHLKDLAKLLEVESNVYPLIVAVSGRVGSETPLKCEQSGILGVLINQTAEEQFLKRNWKFSWVKNCALLKPTSKEVPWYIDDGTGRLNVVGAKDAICFRLTFGSEVFEKSEPSSLVRGTLDYLKGFKMLGVRRTERVLPIGTPLTIVGEAVKDITGEVRIQKPEEWPFYVSPIPLDQLISKSGEWSRIFKYASIGLTVVGVILISKPLIEDILERWRLRLLRRRAGEEAVRRVELAIREAERQHGNSSGGTRRDNSASRRAEPRAEPVTSGSERQLVNISNGSSRDNSASRRSEPVTRRVEPVDAAPRRVERVSRRAEPVTRGSERQLVNISNGSSRDNSASRRSEPVTRRAEPVDAASRRVEPVSRRAEPVTRGSERQLVNISNGSSRDNSASRRSEPVTMRAEPVDAASRRVEPVSRRAEPVTRGLERRQGNSSNGISRDNSDLRHRAVEAASRRAGLATRDRLESEVENNSDATSQDVVPNPCVICHTEKSDAAFVPCGHMYCCITCSRQAMIRMNTCPFCRTRIEHVLKIYRH